MLLHQVRYQAYRKLREREREGERMKANFCHKTNCSSYYISRIVTVDSWRICAWMEGTDVSRSAAIWMLQMLSPDSLYCGPLIVPHLLGVSATQCFPFSGDLPSPVEAVASHNTLQTRRPQLLKTLKIRNRKGQLSYLKECNLY